MVLRYLGLFFVSFVVSAICLLGLQYAVGTVELSQLRFALFSAVGATVGAYVAGR